MNENIWQNREIRGQFTKFVNQLNPTTARSTAYDHGMLVHAQREKLMKDEELGRNHNEHLLGILECRGFEGFKCLLEILKVQNRGTWANELRVLASLPEEAASAVTRHNDAGLTALPSEPPGVHAAARGQQRNDASAVKESSPASSENAGFETASQQDTDEVFNTPEGRAFYGLCLRLDMGSFRNQAQTSGAITLRQNTTLAALAGSGPDVHNGRLLQMYAEGMTMGKYRALAATVKALGHHDSKPYTQFMTFLKGFKA